MTKVTGLVPDNVYEFRVAAENADFMVGEYSNSSHRISTQLPFCKYPLITFAFYNRYDNCFL